MEVAVIIFLFTLSILIGWHICLGILTSGTVKETGVSNKAKCYILVVCNNLKHERDRYDINETIYKEIRKITGVDVLSLINGLMTSEAMFKIKECKQKLENIRSESTFVESVVELNTLIEELTLFADFCLDYLGRSDALLSIKNRTVEKKEDKKPKLGPVPQWRHRVYKSYEECPKCHSKNISRDKASDDVRGCTCITCGHFWWGKKIHEPLEVYEQEGHYALCPHCDQTIIIYKLPPVKAKTIEKDDVLEATQLTANN